MSALTELLASLGMTPGGAFLLMGVAFVAGLVRGFAGFGVALIFMPVAARLAGPLPALIFLLTMDFWGPLPQLPRALREGHRRTALRLLAGAALFMPLGIFLLTRVPEVPLRYGMSIATLLTLSIMVSGYRYQGALGPRGEFGLGALGGLMGGAIGQAGPPVILFYMVRPLEAAVIRANLILYFAGIVVLTFLILALTGHLSGAALLMGLVLTPVYLLAVTLGGRMFGAGGGGAGYRPVAYVVIGLSAVLGLPIW